MANKSLFSGSDVRIPDLNKRTSLWQDFYQTIISLIGASLTVSQAHELVENEWRKFIKENKKSLNSTATLIFHMAMDRWIGQGFRFARNVYSIFD
ncbi:MAG: hypothetical protein KGL95_10655 [Patescibacteria group bacterium]|nr:hypothetical protein [Patescibacteria group bacterium]